MVNNIQPPTQAATTPAVVKHTMFCHIKTAISQHIALIRLTVFTLFGLYCEFYVEFPDFWIAYSCRTSYWAWVLAFEVSRMCAGMVSTVRDTVDVVRTLKDVARTTVNNQERTTSNLEQYMVVNNAMYQSMQEELKGVHKTLDQLHAPDDLRDFVKKQAEINVDLVKRLLDQEQEMAGTKQEIGRMKQELERLSRGTQERA